MSWQFCAIFSHKHTVWQAKLLIIRRQIAEKLLFGIGICHAWHSSRK